jgi:membrane associated rhomboid family serine protease
MFIPIGDENPRERTPYVNYLLLAANVAVFVFFCFPTPLHRPGTISWALVPERWTWETVFTSMFLHANLMHLAGNMVFLWIFGDNVEDKLGHLGYAAAYAAWGVAAAFLHMATSADPSIPMLGASGAISGVVGAYMVFFPRYRVKALLMFGFYWDVILMPAFVWAGLWFVEQVVFSAIGYGGVAYMAHIGGFVAGALVAGVLRALRPASFPGIAQVSRDPGSGRPFVTLDEDAVRFIDEPVERWAVLRRSDQLHSVGAVARAVAETTGEAPSAVAARLEATRGLVARGLPRISAERIARDLHDLHVQTALVADHEANRPPERVPAEAAHWDGERVLIRAGGREAAVPWSAPFLYVGARIGDEPIVDVFTGRRNAFRVSSRTVFTQDDPTWGSARPADLAAFAGAVLLLHEGAAMNDGLRVLARNGSWGWLHFRDGASYEDHLFWVYNLVLSQLPVHRG